MNSKMHDTEFMSAKEKEQVLKDWEKFVASHFNANYFSKQLYMHLILHCSFIAHYNILGFYEYYFLTPGRTRKFVMQFDRRKSGGGSAEMGCTYWLRDNRYADINTAMCCTMESHAERIYSSLCNREKQEDLALATELFRKHGIAPPGEIA